ncbi:MAG TPA: GtrA family protein [Candidatus Paceibacterota bacterium]|nr:GtrA family protein [Candidatus Paceibacterota bacterium]
MPRRDIIRGFVIGAGVGLLIQPILANNVPGRYAALLAPASRTGVFIFFLLLAPFALWVAKLVSRWFPGLYQFAQFAAVGTLNSFIDIGVFNLETFVNGTALIGNGLFAAFKAFSFLCATTNSFFWNKYWTFGSGGKAGAKEVSGFYAIALVGWVLNVGAATLVKAAGPAGSTAWVDVVAPLAGVAASFLWDFFGYKYLVFKKKSD